MSEDEENERLAYADYWDDRYAQTEGGQLHEWFRSFKDLNEFFGRHFYETYPPSAAPRILHLGSGDSTIPQDLADKGYGNQLCVDFSAVVVETMSKRHADLGLSDKIQWEKVDVRQMEEKIPDASVDVAFDKGTLDAMIHGSPWSPPEDTIANTGKYLREVSRVLKPHGVFLYVTFRQPHFIKPLLMCEGTNWDVELEVLGASGGSFGMLSKRQQQQNQVDIFFGRIQNVAAEIYGCYAGGSSDADKIPQGIQPTTVNLGNEGFDPNLDLGVMVYYVKASPNSVFMFDTSTAEVLADSCNQQLQQQTGFAIDKVILSHEHGDHVAGRNANSLKQVPVVAQETLVQQFGVSGGGNVALGPGKFQTFTMQDGTMNVTNVQAHTELGTVAMINGVALMGDELESTLNFLVSRNTQKQSSQLQRSDDILAQNGIVKVLPAHGSGAAMFGGQFDLQLSQSNQQYLRLMATTDFARSVCAQPRGRQQTAQAKARLGQSIGVQGTDITDAYFATHVNENCRTVGAAGARQAKKGQKQAVVNGNRQGGQRQ
ncbi:hypothetical protein V2A60_008087 [Cordyceps javanica]